MKNTGLVIDKPEIPQTFHQLGILVLDGSGSMSEIGRKQLTKAQEVEMGIKEMFSRFDASRVKNNFSFSCIKFDTTPEVTLQPTPFNDIDYFTEDFNPLNGKGGGTHIFEALKEAQKVSENFLKNASKEGLRHSVVILLMSDGMCFEPNETMKVANQIKSAGGIDLACAFLSEIGTNNEMEKNDTKNLMQNIATDPIRYYATVHDGESLRKFFEASISQSSGIKKISQ